MRKRIMFVVAILSGLGSLAVADYVTFIGQNNNAEAPSGSLLVADNWAGGVLPYGSSTGLVSKTVSVWSQTGWYNMAVRQTGGYVDGGTGLSLRGGLSGSGITTIYEIDDSRTNYGSYTNLAMTGALGLWSQYGENIEFNLLSGHVQAGSVNLVAHGKGTIRVGDGILNAGLLSAAQAKLEFLSGGAGTVTLDEIAADVSLVNFYIDFASDSTGSLYIGEVTGGGNTQAKMEWLVNEGRVAVDGVTSTDWNDYSLVVDGTASTLSVIPEPATIGLFAVAGVSCLLFRRLKI